MLAYTLILATVLIVSPFAFKIAEKQDKKTKSRLKHILLFLLVSQILLGLISWKILLPFLAISLVQIFLLTKKNPAKTPTAVLNFINTFVFFFIMIRLDQREISDSTNLAAIAIAFIILIGNVVSLLFINKEKRLQLKPLSRRGKLIFSLLLILAMTTVIGFSFWNKSAGNTATDF